MSLSKVFNSPSAMPAAPPSMIQTSPVSRTTSSLPDVNGAYLFVNLTPGAYTVKILTPPTTKPTNSTPTPGGDNKDNGTQTGFTGVITSGVVTLAPGEVNTTVDFGLLQLANLGQPSVL